MSLRVWLPLTKDLRNQGLDGVTVTTANTNVFQNEGKLGGKSLDVSGHYAFRVPSLVKKRVFSCSFWYKPITDSSLSDNWRRIVVFDTYTSDGSTTGALFRFESSYGYQSSNTSYCISIHNNSGEPIASIGTGLGATDGWNKWQHIAITADGTTLKCYRNGVQVASGNMGNGGMLQGTVHIGHSGNRPVGRLNDFRLYDHCLSPMEVKELAKGLVLHYTLNRNGWGQENLYYYSKDFANWTFYSGATTAIDNGETVISYPNTAGTWPGAIANKTILYSKIRNKTITVSADLKADSGISCGFDPCLLLTASETSISRLKYKDNTYNFTGTGEWIHWSATYNITDALFSSGSGSPDYTNCYFSITFYRRITPTGSFKLKNPKVEVGSIATPWCPNSSDALATTMGLNGTTEYDCSGYCNNANKNGTYSYTSDTSKYAVSTVFNGTEWMNATTPGADILTLACWAKTSKNKSTSQFMVADSTSGMCISFYSGCIIGYFGANGSQDVGSKCTLGNAYKENDWNHFVVVKTGTGTRKIYCNGIEQTATSNDWWGSAAGFFVGSRNNSATLPFYGQICDVRAYATALSADDVKSLYQNSAYIDSSGNVYGAVHSEV